MAKKFIVTLADGTTLEVTPTLQDTLAFESTLRKNPSWGKLENNALKMTPFKCWNALKRQGQIDLTWEQFTTGDTAALECELAPDDEPGELDELEVPAVGKATKPARSAGSSSASHSALESLPASGD